MSIRWLVALSSVVMVACSSEDCDPDAAAAIAAGADAIDCGRVPVDGDPTVVDACAAGALAARRPFRAHYDIQGIDSKIASFIAGTSSGVVQTFSYDSDPSGGGGKHPTLGRAECTGAHVETTDGKKKIVCASMGASARVCG